MPTASSPLEQPSSEVAPNLSETPSQQEVGYRQAERQIDKI
jgi:hypothetical protein